MVFFETFQKGAGRVHNRSEQHRESDSLEGTQRRRALGRLTQLNWTLLSDYKFSDDEANEP